MGLDHAFWDQRRVFLTGHTGFKGGWLSLWLQRLGADLTGYALAPPTDPSMFETARVDEGMRSYHGDVRDLQQLVDRIAEHRPEIVIHMAAQALVRHSYQEPVTTYETNVMGTVNVLEAVRKTPAVKAVLIVTSDKCYENREWLWGYRESEALGGHDPYSSSKACAEIVSAAYRNSFFSSPGATAVASARAGNVIGGGDWAPDRLVPDIMRCCLQDQAPLIRNPGSVRPWQHVLEPLSGYLTLVERLYASGSTFAEAWNFGPHPEACREVGWVVDYLTRRWNGAAGWSADRTAHPHEANLLKLDPAKAIARLGWKPHLDLETALDWTCDWYRNAADPDRARAITFEQIDSFERLMASS